MKKLFILLATLSAIATPSCAQLSADMNRKAIALTRLSSAVEGKLWAAPDRKDDLIQEACQQDRALCAAFTDDNVQFKVIEGNAVLLVCTQDQKRALLEDIACTPELERHAWQEKNAKCEFTLSPKGKCL